jgi:hypothetical protein
MRSIAIGIGRRHADSGVARGRQGPAAQPYDRWRDTSKATQLHPRQMAATEHAGYYLALMSAFEVAADRAGCTGRWSQTDPRRKWRVHRSSLLDHLAGRKSALARSTRVTAVGHGPYPSKRTVSAHNAFLIRRSRPHLHVPCKCLLCHLLKSSGQSACIVGTPGKLGG